MYTNPIRFQYEAAAVENPAAMMARGGYVLQPGQDSPPIQEPTPPTEAPAPAPSGETPAPAAPPPTEAPAPAPAAAPIEAPKPPSWQEVLKSQEPKQVLRELLGVDDSVASFMLTTKTVDPKMVAFLNHWQNKGNINEYFEALSTDYQALSPEQVMRHQLRREYPELSADDFEILYDDRVKDRYKIDPSLYSEEEVKRGRVLLAADAKKVRDQLVQSQQNYLLPKPPEVAAPAPEIAQQLAEYQALRQNGQAQVEAYRTQLQADNFSKEILTNKRLVVGEGDTAFNFAVADPQKLQNILTDQDAWAKAMFNPDGTPNFKKQWLLAAIAADDGVFFTEFAKHLISVGKNSLTSKIENPSPPPGAAPSAPDPTPSSPAAAMAKSGRIVRA